MQISLLILALNEEKNISPLLSEAKAELEALGLTYEVVVVDGGSRDNTVAEAEKEGARAFIQKRPGYAGGLREGMLACNGEYVLTLDADRSHPPSLIKDLWLARDRAEIVIASRYVEGGQSDNAWFRRALSDIINSVFMRLLSMPVRDLSSGFRLYHRSALKPEEYTAQNFSILQEVLITAYIEGLRVAEIPFHYLLRDYGKSHARFFSFGLSYLTTFKKLWSLRNRADAADYDDRAYDSRIPIQRYWQRKRFAIVKEFLGEGAEGPKTLDIGCGSSRIIQSMPQAVALDFSIRKLRFLHKTNPKRVRGSAFALPFSNEAFERVVHSQVLEHLPNDDALFTELNRVLTLGGHAVVGTPDYGRLWWRFVEWVYGILLPNAYADEHITHYTRHSLCELLAQNGFRILSWRYVLAGELIVHAQKVESI